MSNKSVQAYLFFGGRCEEALAFYRTAVGAEVDMLMRYYDSPQQLPREMFAPGYEGKVMHTTFRIGETTLMGTDGCGEPPAFLGFRLALSLPTEAEADQAFTALSAGGSVQMPLTKTFWSPCFGMLTDQFGIGWMVSVPGGPPK